MYSRFAPRLISCAVLVLVSAAAFATTPVVIIVSPGNGSQTTSPVNFIATASSPECADGISAMRLYSAPYVSAYTVGGGQMNTYINLTPGKYNTVVVAWDSCGGVASAGVTITTTAELQAGGFVYTANTDYWSGDTANFVQGFSIVAGNGALAPLLQGPVKANVAPYSVASDAGGYRLYVGDRVSGDIFPYFMDRSNGSLTPVPGAPFPVDRSVTAVAVHPSGKLIFAARNEQAAGDGVAVFQLQSNGALVQAAGSPYATQIGPQTLVVDPSGKYLYVADFAEFINSVNRDYIDAFEIDESSGSLTPVAGSPFPIPVASNCTYGSANATDIIDLAGTNVYTADSWMDSISGFTITGSNGTLTDMAGSPWADEGGCVSPPDCSSCSLNPSSLAIDGTGKFLYGLNSAASVWNIAIYSIGSNGALTFVKYAANQEAGCFGGPIRMDSTGNYLYTSACAGVPDGYVGLAGFSINHTTGDLTELPTSPYTYPNQSTKASVLQSFTVTP
jgi:6-phosphogluconolactonase (cycloisomerase 2 family)